METVFNIFLFIHIVSGVLSLTTGSINFVRRKEDLKHKRVGRVFFYSMFTAGFSSFILSIIHPNYFLFTVGVFSVYLVITGLRYLRFKNPDLSAETVDWLISGVMLLSSLAMVMMGIRVLLAGNSFGIVFLAFGFAGGLFSITDFANFRGKFRSKNFWQLVHLQRMTGAFIASATAFLVVNTTDLTGVIPSFVAWLLPSAVLVPMIFIWNKRYAIEKDANENSDQ